MDNTIKQNFSFMQFASYTAPAIVEHKNKHWVEYGEDNDYYQYLIDLYLGSPTNNAAIKGIADLVYGLGLEVVKSDRNLKGYIEFKKLIKPDCIRAVTLDLKMLGQYAFHCVKSKDKKSYVKISHWPIQTLRPERCNDKGEIEGWYFCADWSKLKRGQQPKRFASFGFDENDNECILVVKPYSTGSYYFAPVDYQGGTQWADLECEISNYHINNIKNGLAPSMLINFNNGQPPEEVRNAIEGQINAKWSGSSNAGRAIISFNDSKETATEITPVQLSDAHNQYEFLSRESTQKIMLAHRIVSPMLLGIKDNTGLGNNADELRSASILFDNIVIRPFQRLIIEGVEKVLNANGISLEMYFKTLQPLEFTDLSGKEVTEEVKEQEMGFSSQKKKYDFVKPNAGETEDDFISRCIGVVVGEGKDQDQAAAICYNYWEGSVQLAESYTDYPESASNNAKKALEWAEKNGWGDCGTPVGKARANQLAKREPISRETIARMAAFRRHQQNKDVPYSEGCGGLMWDAWGGESGIAWAERKLKEIDTKLSAGDKVSFDFDDTLSTKRGQELAKQEIESGSMVYVISARQDKEPIFKIADELGIPHSRVFATGSNQAKIEKINELGITKHYDNNSSVVKQLEDIGVQFKCEMSNEDEQQWLEYLKDKGQVIDESVWELIDESPVNDPDNEQHLSRHEFFKRFANPDEKSKDDKGIYLIRYRYAPFRVQENSRIFCKDMVANAKLGVTYRREDIDVMGDAGINGQFAPSGKSSYSIWKYKGGVYCKHQWFRLTYRRKKINGKIIPLTSEEKEQNMRDIVDNYDRVSSQSADRAGVPFDPPSWDIASVKTNDLPNRGSLKNK